MSRHLRRPCRRPDLPHRFRRWRSRRISSGCWSRICSSGSAGATVATSLRHGPFVAALGVVGAFAVPLLVGSDQPSALPLFAYLTVVSVASLVVLRYREWWWLAWIWLGGILFWVLAWLAI